jgi:hypothetical protein
VITSNALLAAPVLALSKNDIEAIRKGTTFYDPNACEISGSSTGTASAIQDGTIYRSGLQPPYILEQFMISILKRLAQKYNKPEGDLVTKEHVIALLAFADGEGGDIQNSSLFNPMNTSYRDADIAPIAYAAGGRDGRQAYPSFDMGVEAYARHMSRPDQYQNRLGSTLSIANSTAEQFMSALTYFNKYPGNKTWATAALSNPDGYYKDRLSLVKTVRDNYASIAGLVIGTPAHEQAQGIRKTDLIFYKDLIKAGQASNTDINNLTSDGCLGATNTSNPTGSKTFTTNTTISYPGAADAVRRANAIAVLNSRAFNIACAGGSPNCSGRCDHLAGEAWGYSSSGYDSAKIHWQTMVATGKAHPGDRNPPVGASLFYDNAGPYGHITTYLGDGLLLSNDVNDSKSGVNGGAYIVPTDFMEKGPWNLTYLGWADPIFGGSKQTPGI